MRAGSKARPRRWTRTADSGQTTTYHFCPECGSTVYYGGGNFPELVAIPLGALDDPYIVDSPDYSARGSGESTTGWTSIRTPRRRASAD